MSWSILHINHCIILLAKLPAGNIAIACSSCLVFYHVLFWGFFMYECLPLMKSTKGLSAKRIILVEFEGLKLKPDVIFLMLTEEKSASKTL